MPSFDSEKYASAAAKAGRDRLSAKQESSVTRWYVVYTRARHEKSVSAQLDRITIQNFLPLYEALHRWKDRRARVKIPLFAGYVFVRMALCNQLQVLQIPGVARLVSFDGQPVAVPEAELVALQRGLTSGVRVNPHPYLAAGRQVQITKGSFAGLKGVFVRRKGLCRVVVSLHVIKSSIALEMEADDVSAS